MKIVRNKGVLENSINIYNLPHEPVRNAAGERRVSDSDTQKMNYDNLKYPKQGKKKRKKPKLGKYPCERQKESIIPGDKKGRCYICGSHVNIQNHHIFFGNGSREQFMKIFGENCLEEEDEKKD